MSENFCHDMPSLIVIGDDLRCGDSGGVDLAVDKETGDTGFGGASYGGDGGVGASIVEDDRSGVGGDRGVDEVVLTVGVVVMGIDAHTVTESTGARGRGVGLRLEEGVVLRGDDNGDETL